LFKIYRYWYADLLFEVKFHFVSEHLPDDSDKFAGTVPKGIIVSLSFGSLGIVVSFESRIVLYNIMCCIYESVTKNTRSSFGHLGLLSLEVTRLTNRRIQSGKCKQFAQCREAMDIANLTKYIPPLVVPMPGMVMSAEWRQVTRFAISSSVWNNWLSNHSICTMV